MARHVEEDENYWPGFVDALSTIVMVVTFLLIILGVAIFAISTQVSKALSEASQAATEKTPQAVVEKLETQVTASQQQRQQAEAKAATAAAALAIAAQAEAAAQSEAVAAKAQLAALAAEKAQDDAKAQAMAAQLAQAQAAAAAAKAAVESSAAAELSDSTQKGADAAKAQALSAQLAAAEAAKASAEAAAKSAAEALDAKAAEQAAAAAKLAAQTQQLAAAEATVAQQSQQLATLTSKIATLNQAGSPAPTQDEAVKADNALKISSRQVANPTQIMVAAPQDATDQKPVQVTAASEVLTVRFQAGAVRLDDAAHAQAVDFVNTNGSVISSHKISLWSFYDASSLGLTQVKRSAYFRALALRNALLDAKVDTTKIDISVRAAEAPADVDTVKAFLQQ
jgi:uncharacterized membrane protein